MQDRERYFVSNGAGWELAMTVCRDRDAFVPGRRPLLIVPGYGMNSHIFGYHPSGPSMVAFLAAAGFEVWTVDFRAQGEARRTDGARDYHVADIALVDLPITIAEVLRRTETDGDRVDCIGCSLGGAYLYAHVASRPDHRVGALVAMGAPLRWERIHPLVRIALGSTWLAGTLRFDHTRALAEKVFPVLLRFPALLRIYLHPEHVDTSRIDLLLKTVDNPNPCLNYDLAVWLRTRDLHVGGVNVTEGVGRFTGPFLGVIANGDGIVPEETAASGYHAVGSARRDILRIGDDRIRFAHADLFVSRYAQERVFAPLATWLAEQSGNAAREATGL